MLLPRVSLSDCYAKQVDQRDAAGVLLLPVGVSVWGDRRETGETIWDGVGLLFLQPCLPGWLLTWALLCLPQAGWLALVETVSFGVCSWRLS